MSEQSARYGAELGMSNFDGSIDEGLDEYLRGGARDARHYAWDFNGELRFEGGLYYEDVYRYGNLIGTVSAASLRELMTAVNDQYGWS